MRSNVDEAPRPHGEGVSVQENPFLEVRDIVKNFGGVRALDGVNMAVWPGEVLCLAGENGCGKSTLIKVISGVHAPDAGRILIDGHTVSSLTPLSAMDAGIQVIYQDFSLFSNLTVAENIMMTSSVTEKKKFFSSTSAKQQAAQIVERLGVPLPLDADVEQGRNVIDSPVEDLDREKITHYMTGKELDQSRRVPPLAEDAEERLRVESLTSQGGFEDVSFSVKKGEILGITGLLGSGRTEIAQALFGLLPIDSGRVYIDGEHVEVGSIGQAIKAHIGYVPEDRLTEGLFLDKSIADNVIAASIDHHTSKLNTLRKDKIRQTIAHYFESLRIKAPDVLAPVRSLSGGNAQRVVLAKWLARSPKVLILNGPTVGVDVGSKAEILDILREQAEAGMAIVIISDDAPELVSCCHRVLITKGGHIAAELAGEDVDARTIRKMVVS